MPLRKPCQLPNKMKLSIKKFAKMVFNKNFDVFVVYKALFILKRIMYLAQEAQIALLIIEEIIILVKYFDFADLFLKK